MWFKDIPYHGKKYTFYGDPTPHLSLTVEQVQDPGDDLQYVIEWFRDNGRELGLVMLWRESHYNTQFFSRDDLALIHLSDFASEEDRRAISNALYPQWQRQPREKDYPKPSPKNGFVYLLHSNGTYKIGQAKDITRRTLQINPLLPHPVELVHQIQTNDCIKLENELHERFSAKRLNGEWFNLSPEDVEYIRSL